MKLSVSCYVTRQYVLLFHLISSCVIENICTEYFLTVISDKVRLVLTFRDGTEDITDTLSSASSSGPLLASSPGNRMGWVLVSGLEHVHC